jgi:hypothetical protein
MNSNKKVSLFSSVHGIREKFQIILNDSWKDRKKMYCAAGKVGNKKLFLEIIMQDSKIRHKQEIMYERHEQHDMKFIYSHLLSKEQW